MAGTVWMIVKRLLFYEGLALLWAAAITATRVLIY